MPSRRRAAADDGLVLDQAGGNVALDLFVLDQRLGALLEDALSGLEMTPAQYAVYAQLARGARTPGAIREVLGIPAATLSGYLRALERRGHVERERSPKDGRSVVFTLTAEGRAATAAARARIGGRIRALNAELGGPEEVVKVRRVLGRVERAIDAAERRT